MLFVLVFRSDYYTQNGGLVKRILVSTWFGLATFAGASLNTLVLKLILPQEKENKWKVRHEIMLYAFHFFTIAVFNFLLASFVLRFIESFSFWSFLSVVSSTLLVGIIPVSIHVLQLQKKLYKANYDLATELNQSLHKEESNDQQNRITIKDEEVIIEEIVFVESKKNYVYLASSNDEPITIRMTLKEVEKILAEYVQFVRCHRAFIVNLDRIVNVEGNAQGLKLYLNDTSNYVPVSRSYIPKVDHLIRPA